MKETQSKEGGVQATLLLPTLIPQVSAAKTSCIYVMPPEQRCYGLVVSRNKSSPDML